MMFKMGDDKIFNNYKKERHTDPAVQACRDAIEYDPEWEREAEAFEPEENERSIFEPESWEDAHDEWFE